MPHEIDPAALPPRSLPAATAVVSENVSVNVGGMAWLRPLILGLAGVLGLVALALGLRRRWGISGARETFR